MHWLKNYVQSKLHTINMLSLLIDENWLIMNVILSSVKRSLYGWNLYAFLELAWYYITKAEISLNNPWSRLLDINHINLSTIFYPLMFSPAPVLR